MTNNGYHSSSKDVNSLPQPSNLPAPGRRSKKLCDSMHPNCYAHYNVDNLGKICQLCWQKVLDKFL